MATLTAREARVRHRTKRVTRTRRPAPAIGAVLAGLMASGLAVGSAEAGPPGICLPIEPEHGRRIERSIDEFREHPRAVVDFILATLDEDLAVVARMETLRLATLALASSPGAGFELRARLAERALDRVPSTPAVAVAADDRTANRGAALAWLDAGYLSVCFEQMGIDEPRRPRASAGRAAPRGYAWILRAIRHRPDDAGLHLAAAIAVTLHPGGAFDAHLEAAARLAEPGDATARAVERVRRRLREIRSYVEPRFADRSRGRD